MLVFADYFEGVESKVGEEEEVWVLSFLQSYPYILKINEDFIENFEAILQVEFGQKICRIVVVRHCDLWKWGVVVQGRLWRVLYFFSVSPSFENACSGSHKASVIGYPCHLTKYW